MLFLKDCFFYRIMKQRCVRFLVSFLILTTRISLPYRVVATELKIERCVESVKAINYVLHNDSTKFLVLVKFAHWSSQISKNIGGLDPERLQLTVNIRRNSI